MAVQKKHPRVFNLILLGDPASGKGTQAARLITRYHFYNLDMGKEVKKPGVITQYDYQRTTAIGNLTPTAVVRNIFKRVIHAVPPHKGILFNGTPKMLNEAQLVARLLRQHKRTDPLVIYLSIPMGEVLHRIRGRKEYIAGKFVKRDDDTERALQNRRKYYKEQIARVVKFFHKEYAVKKISGVGSREAVEKKIDAAIDAHFKKERTKKQARAWHKRDIKK